MTDDVRKLLGGYATGTLTPEESELLFRTALTNQELFDALADEQPLKEMLQDGRIRGELSAALGSESASPRHQALGWIFSGTIAVSALIIFWIGLRPQHRETLGKVFQPPPAARNALGSARTQASAADRRGSHGSQSVSIALGSRC